MCKIIGAIAITNKKKMLDLIDMNEADLRLERDGFGFYSDKKHIQSLEYKFDRVDFENFFMLHTRTATTGAVTRDNAHTYKIDDWVFAHNGWTNEVGARAKTWKQAVETMNSKTDSKQFFTKLYERGITHENIKKLVASSGFYGIGVLINQIEGIVIIISKGKPVQFYTDSKNSGLVFSSYAIENDHETMTNKYGLVFDSRGDTQMELYASTNNEILEFDLESGALVDSMALPATAYNPTPYRDWSKYYGYDNPLYDVE